MSVTTSSSDNPDDYSNWRFDPANPPNVFTKTMLGRMSVSQLRLCRDPETSPLNESQQRSFDEVYPVWSREFLARVTDSAKPVLAKAVAPTTDQFRLALRGFELSPALRESAARMEQTLRSHLEAASELGAVETTVAVPRPTTPETRAVDDLTADGLEEKIEEESAQVALLEELTAVTRRQSEMSARGMVFYVVVGLGSALSGIATVVGLGDTSDVLWSLGLLLVVAFVAWGSYEYRRRKQADD